MSKHGRKSNIYLIGFMGAGKSTLGPVLSRILGRTFVDTDRMIEKKTKSTIRKLFRDKGEDYFRDVEAKIVEKISCRKKQVIALGGGALLKKENISKIRNSGLVVYLKVPATQLFKRLSSSRKQKKGRPLLQSSNLSLKRVRVLLRARMESYEMADFVINAKGDHLKSASKVIDALAQRGFIR